MPRPIFFDLYFTLVTPDSTYDWATLSAPLLGIDVEHFRQVSATTFADRMDGTLPTAEAIVQAVLDRLELTVDSTTYATLIQHRLAFFDGVQCYFDAVSTLQTLRANGHSLALVTNCSNETIAMLERLELSAYFDVIAYSSQIGVVKPHPLIYQYALDQLHVDPKSVMYVGDGGDNEHAGAAYFGMTTVLLQRPEHPPRDVQTDYTIHTLPELFDLIATLKD